MTTKQYYECHVTFIGEGHPKWAGPPSIKGWTFSRITDDPELGPGIKCYLTRHFPAKQRLDLITDALHGAAAMLIQRRYAVLRLKMELVVYDKRPPF